MEETAKILIKTLNKFERLSIVRVRLGGHFYLLRRGGKGPPIFAEEYKKGIGDKTMGNWGEINR